MYIVRWLMSHPIVATWVLGAIAILLTVGSGKKEVVSEQEKISEDTIELSEVIKSDDDSGSVEVTNELNPTDDSKSAIIEENIESNLVDKSKNVSDTKIEVSKEMEPAAKALTTTLNDKEETLESKVADDSNGTNEVESKDSAIADLRQVTSEEMLLMAREAFWNNGLDESAQIYKNLIKMEPKILEHRGELGNVYWRQGYPKKAAELYSEIAIPMIEEGNSEKVVNMIGFIGLFYPDRAAEIHNRMQATTTSNVQN